MKAVALVLVGGLLGLISLMVYRHRKTNKNDGMNKEMKLDYWAVAFIDLLGQGDKLDAITSIPDNPTENAEFMKSISGTIFAVDNLQTACEKTFTHFCNRDPASALPKEISLKMYKELMRSKIQFQRFSDGLVAFVSLSKDENHLPMNGITGLLATLGLQMPVFLSIKTPFRCGVDIGFGVEMNPNELYGSAVRNAYRLESKVAGYPRIVIGSDLIEYMKAFLSVKNDATHDADTSKVLAKRCLDSCIVDVDGHAVFDYLGENFMSDLTGVETKKEVMKSAYTFVQSEAERHREKKNSKLAFRYVTLLNYFEHNRKNWE